MVGQMDNITIPLRLGMAEEVKTMYSIKMGGGVDEFIFN